MINLVVEKFTQLIDDMIKAQANGIFGETKPEYREVSATLQFTKEECKKMGATAYEYMLDIGRVVRVIKRAYADRTVYIVRLRRDEINVEAMDEDINEAKRKFIDTMLKTFEAQVLAQIRKELEVERLERERGQVLEM